MIAMDALLRHKNLFKSADAYSDRSGDGVRALDQAFDAMAEELVIWTLKTI
jgi:ABC-type uncharacterized transport system auxiliary subunit